MYIFYYLTAIDLTFGLFKVTVVSVVKQKKKTKKKIWLILVLRTRKS